MMMDGVRDALAAHYAAPAAQAVFGLPILSPQLAAALDQVARRGRMPFREEAPLLTQEFQALLAALGHPHGASPQARVASAVESEAASRRFREQAKAALAFAPPYAQFMAR